MYEDMLTAVLECTYCGKEFDSIELHEDLVGNMFCSVDCVDYSRLEATV